MTKQYIAACKDVLENGVMIPNLRTGVGCLTIPHLDMEYNVGAGEYPMVTTRKAPFKLAIAELLGYIRGTNNAADFEALGTKSWYSNANKNEAWLNNPNRKGENDCGRIYGVQGRDWIKPQGGTVDQLRKIYTNLKAGYDDRGEILNFWNPGEHELGCLRPCLFMHIFTLVDGLLTLHSTQRSNDLALGNVANMQQCYLLLALMAQITGNEAGIAYHRTTNAHIYENQIELMKTQVKREPRPAPKLWINPKIRTLEDLETWVTTDDFKLISYVSDEPIDYPFAV